MDVGSVAVKAVLVHEGEPRRWLEEPTRPDMAAQCAALLRRLDAGAAPVCATGYGRGLVVGADSRVSEIMANAAGADWLWSHWASLGEVFGAGPSPAAVEGRFRTIVDVGGQDSKVITFDDGGLMADFAMNDRCAAGTGRFLEVMARVLETDLVRLDECAARADEPADITAACTVFAESEVISLLADGVPREHVAAGVFESVASQVAVLAVRCRWRPPLLFDGGPSQSRALCAALGRRLGCRPAVPPCGQFATALGAALIAERGAAGRERPDAAPRSI
jgi:predicted CoA-substrate-specific enzyme activase